MQQLCKSTLRWVGILAGLLLLWNLPPLPVDYQRLEQSLEAGDFKQADWLTRNIIFRLASQENLLVRTIREIFEPVYSSADLDRIPCQDLTKIDQLWRIHSNEKFGFTVQQQIWKQYYHLNSHQFASDVNLRRRKLLVLAWHVGWLEEKQRYITASHHQQLTFDLTAPRGHLPSWLWTDEESRPTPSEESKYNFMFERIQQCASADEPL